MRQLKMIQDWGFNYIYLRQQEAITRVNLKDHSYRDVAWTPVEDFESTTTDIKSTIPSWANTQTHLWMCGASDTDSLLKEQCALSRDAPDEAYVPEPFPEDDFEPIKWRGILATLDVCVNKTTPTVFCDEEGYNVIPICMINVHHSSDSPKEALHEQEESKSDIVSKEQEELDAAILRLGLQEEISIRDLSEEEDEEVIDQVFYDASDELGDSEDDLAEAFETGLQLRDNLGALLPPESLKNKNKKARRKKQGHTKGQRMREMPRVKDKTTYLRLVNANDCVKNKVTGCYLTQKTQRETRSRKAQSKQGEVNKQTKPNSTETKPQEPPMTRLERKQKYKEQKQILKELWTTEMEDSSENDEGISVPSHFKRYTIKEQKVVVQQPIRTQQAPGELYDGLEGSKKID